MKYDIVEKFDKLGFVKTFMVRKGTERWRIYSHNNTYDLKYYDELAKNFDVTRNDIVRLLQLHSANVRVVDNTMRGEGVVRLEATEGYDGAITNVKGILLCTTQSDCTPVYLVDTKNKAIGMIHSGWRGTVNSITLNAIELMNKNYGTKKEDLLIHFGPAICGNCYEVGAELKDEFRKILSENEIELVFKKKNGDSNKFLLNVTYAINLNLIKNGISQSQISRTDVCTYHDNMYNSWRLDRDKTKQMLTGIILV